MPTLSTAEPVDVVVIGAGVVGLAVARALALAGREVWVLESESGIGSGVSARSSEVIHAGIYYPQGSLKARLCVQGKQMLYAYCAERGVAHRRCGKLLVATSLAQMAELAQVQARALANGVDDLQLLSAAEAAALEPALHCHGALLSPSTGIVDSHGLMLALQGDLENAGSQVVLATDEHPHLVRRLSQSLVSRMLAGMVVRVDAPDLCLRNALVKSIALRQSIALAPEAIEAIALRCVGGAREILGAVSSLQAVQSTQQHSGEISRAMVDALLRHEQAASGGLPIRIGAIMDAVCASTGVLAEELVGQSKHRRVALARALVAWLARQHTSMSFPEIARTLRRNSHSSVHASVAKIDCMIQANESVDAGAVGTCGSEFAASVATMDGQCVPGLQRRRRAYRPLVP